MSSDRLVPAEILANADVMGAVEDGPVERFVIADVTTDEAYLRLPLAEAASLPAWR